MATFKRVLEMEKRLERIPHEGAIAGVCAGLAAYFSIDKTWVRLAFILSVFFSGYMGIGLMGPVIYIILWIVLPVRAFLPSRDPFDVDYRTPESRESAASEEGTPPYAWSAGNPAAAKRSGNPKDRYVAGAVLLIVGLIFLLHQLDILYWRDFARYWPVLIIFMGLASIVGAFRDRRGSPFTPKEEPGQPDENETGQTYTK